MENKKVYVLTDCAAEDNYTPEVFTDKNKAIERLKDLYESYLCEGDYVVSDELYDTRAEIFYVDDTYNILEVFEVEVK